MTAARAALSTRERAFALAAARALGADADRFCSARSPGLGAHAATLADPLLRAREARTLAQIAPSGLDRIDCSWYVPPPPVERADAANHLGRAAYGQLVSMGDDADALSQRPPEEIEGALVALGRRRVALAFVAAPRAGLAQLCARLGEPFASELVEEVRALKAAAAPADQVKAAQRALFRSGEGVDAGRRLFLRVGAAWLAPALGGCGDELCRVAQRLPRALGKLLLEEVFTPTADAERAAALSLLPSFLTKAARETL